MMNAERLTVHISIDSFINGLLALIIITGDIILVKYFVFVSSLTRLAS